MPANTASQGSIFKRGDTLNLKLVVVVLLSLMLIAVDHRFHKGHLFRNWVETAAYPIQKAIDLPQRFVLWLVDGVRSHETLLEENATLHSRNQLLQHRLQTMEAVEAENDRLRKLLNASFVYGAIHQSSRVRLAEIISIQLDAFSQEITLNKGSQDGVYIGQPLMDSSGVMGQITRTTPYSSTALLLSSPHHSIPVQNRRNGIRSIAIGTGDPNQLRLRFVPSDSDLIPGDTLITSGLGGRFPYGYPVGTVRSIDRREGERFAEITINASAALEQSRELLLVWPSQKEVEPK